MRLNERAVGTVQASATQAFEPRRSALFFTLLWSLVSRDVTARYRRSVLGPAWALIQPVFLMTVFTVLHTFVEIPSDGVPYVIFSYTALVPWTFFATAINGGGASIMGNAGIIKKIAVPRVVFPLAAALTAAFDLAMSGLVLAAMMLWFRVPIGLSLMWVPVLVGMTAALALSVGMLLAAVGTFKRDFLFAGGFLVQLWLYMSPIIYPLSSVPARWRDVYVLNPMVGILEGFRAVLIRGTVPNLELLGWSALGIAAAWAVAWPTFRIMSQYFADVL